MVTEETKAESLWKVMNENARLRAELDQTKSDLSIAIKTGMALTEEVEELLARAEKAEAELAKEER